MRAGTERERVLVLVLSHHVVAAGQLLELLSALEYPGVNVANEISEFAIQLRARKL